MAKKPAITISCAVSLGSYEATVVPEILEALAQYNPNKIAWHHLTTIDF
jgi:hypothetical protein